VRRFIPALRRISGDLSLPEPAKSRVLLEMASDLESLFEHYRGRGLDEEEAARLTEEKLLASPEALRHLVAVHTTGYQRWVARAAGGLRWGFNLLLFAVGVVPMVAMGAWVAAGEFRLLGGAPLLWPMLLLAATAAAITAVKGWQLYVARERSTPRLHRWLPTLVFLGVLAPVLGAVAFLTTLYRSAMAGMGGAGPAMQREVAAQIARDGALFALGLLLGIAAGVTWFVLVNRIAAIEQAESAALLAVE
jgi:hypothetical protein